MTPNGASTPALARPQDAARVREPLIDANALAIELGVSRDFVYEHANELGVLRLGSGPKARLRFDPAVARGALASYGSERSQAPNLNAGQASDPVPTARRRRLPNPSPQPGSILPVRPRRKAGGH
jgi:hypothetical protein